MTHYSGYVTLPTNSYEAFRDAVNGNSYDADGVAGCQCVDLAKEINWNLGFSSPYWDTGGTGSAYGGWSVESARTFNAGSKYTLIYDKTQIKKGDMIVINYFTGNPYGHVGFADEDYHGNTIRMCSQNNGGTPAPGGGTTVNIANYSLTNFLGAFRLNAWQPTPPTPSSASSERFPWVLYARKLRQKRSQP